MSQSAKKRVLSGVQATGKPHIGNYFGAMKQFADLQDEFESHIMIADYHALNTVQNPHELGDNIIGVATDYLAIGLDPKKVVIFKQSDISAHTELAWIFNTLTTMPYLMRAHAYKDAEAKNKEISVGTFDYPMLMAADILLYSPDVVPVGQDQKQHVEIARDTAEKFNHLYGETFKLPKELIKEDVKVVPGTDGRKMSKSYNNTIPLFADDETLKKAVMSIPTDSKGIDEPKDLEKDNVFALHKLFTTGTEFDDLKNKYEKGGMGYKESKEILIKNIAAFIAPLRAKRAELEKDKNYVLDVLKEGGKKAREIAEAKMAEVRAKIGVKLY
ncbi:tryptophan--tRNA ligase [Candidatus Parcubacteria bacterium]|nr:tryptophan--tRNA ligase [Candidatus Parcubacteria bacterium]